MGMKPSPVRRMSSAPSDFEGYHTCYHSDSAGAEPDLPAGRSGTAPKAELAYHAKWEALPRSLATARVPSHTELGMMGLSDAGDAEEERRMDGEEMGDSVMGGGEEQ